MLGFKHMSDLDTKTLYYYPTTGKLEWRCKYCPKRYTLNGGTFIIKQHLQLAYRILASSPRQERLIKRQRIIKEAITFGEKHPRKRQLIALNNSKHYTLIILD
jgi:hypothetical protein